LYVGVTSDLVKRIWEHKNDIVEGFTKRYRVHTLVWYEVHETMESAIRREKAVKAWKRQWKVTLIENEIRTGRIDMQSCSERPAGASYCRHASASWHPVFSHNY